MREEVVVRRCESCEATVSMGQGSSGGGEVGERGEAVGEEEGEGEEGAEMGRLRDELLAAQAELGKKEEQVAKLSRIRDEVEAELEELTSSLFQVLGWCWCLGWWCWWSW